MVDPPLVLTAEQFALALPDRLMIGECEIYVFFLGTFWSKRTLKLYSLAFFNYTLNPPPPTPGFVHCAPLFLLPPAFPRRPRDVPLHARDQSTG